MQKKNLQYKKAHLFISLLSSESIIRKQLSMYLEFPKI